ncbi:hypothetical protein D1AOALGA4SA_4430 [Olavius algarvensis Delta 1 endosymbiont]|nr:hypothetical protein D1AOALGA4SA_4430 [Olavius algarvensis Delta 1 endosymbiont]
MTNDGIASGFVPRYRGTTTRHVAQSFLNRQNTVFDVRCWTFDVQRSSISFPIRRDIRDRRQR